MQFSDSSGKQGLIEDITFLTGIGTTEYSLADRTRNINEHYRKVWAMIFESYGGWRFMDDNVSGVTGSGDVPYADQTVTIGTDLYALPSGSLAITGIELINQGGTTFSTPLQPLTYEEYLDAGGDGALNGSNAQPWAYLLQGDVLRLVPTPNYTLAKALRVFFHPDVSTFTTADTTKVPGYASTFHRMLSIGAAWDWCSVKGPQQRAANLAALYSDYEKRLKSFYQKRWTDRFPGKINGRSDLLAEYS